jgi:hypothetical protein
MSHLPTGHISFLVQLPPCQAQGQGQASTSSQDGSFHSKQANIQGTFQANRLAKEMPSSMYIQHRQLVMVQLVGRLHSNIDMQSVWTCAAGHAMQWCSCSNLVCQ